ncbi:hypothetical protein [Companilactobacillus sp.]|uniref:hypothetical protein n=2 Tax=Companilactobacillus sp. TaxID=2767905 RepID=UPI0025B883F6|nr:hypothetical protein [Companilactobacillus sp.]MCI1383817.1 hypothetical protein [Companilactobacillus sp.]
MMKDKKVLRKNTKTTNHLMIIAKVAAIVTAVVFLLALLYGTANAAVSKELSNQYQDEQLGVLKKNTNNKTLDFIGALIKVSDGKIITGDNVTKYRKIQNQLAIRQKQVKLVTGLYDGKNYYQNTVTKKRLDDIDKQLLKEKNQDVYQVQKNKLDTIRIWFEQTNDAIKYIDEIWNEYNDDKSSLSIKNISLVNTYAKLIKNKQVKRDLDYKIQELNKYYKAHSNDDIKVKDAKAKLTALKNSPLTMKYTPANVDIISDLDNSSKATDELSSAGITAKHVLYYDKSKGRISYMTLTDGNYVSDGSDISVTSGNVASGQYQIKAIIDSASDNAAIITDSSSGSFGKYLSNASDDTLSNLGITNADNSTANYNQASPVFWFKNNPSLENSIYFGDSSTIGFISSGGSSYQNGVKISTGDLSTIKSKVSTGTVFYVK